MSEKKEHPARYERSDTMGRLQKYAILRFTDKKDAQSVSCGSTGSKLKARQQYETTHKACSCAVNNIIPQGRQCLMQTI